MSYFDVGVFGAIFGALWMISFAILAISVTISHILIALPVYLLYSKELGYKIACRFSGMLMGSYLAKWWSHGAKFDYIFTGDVLNSEGKLQREKVCPNKEKGKKSNKK